MKLSVPKVNINTRQIVKTVSDFVTTASKNKKCKGYYCQYRFVDG